MAARSWVGLVVREAQAEPEVPGARVAPAVSCPVCCRCSPMPLEVQPVPVSGP